MVAHKSEHPDAPEWILDQRVMQISVLIRAIIFILPSLLVPSICPAPIWAQSPDTPSLQRFEFRSSAMGSNLDLILYAHDEWSAAQAIAEALEELDTRSQSINNYDPSSAISRLQDLKTDEELKLPEDLANCLVASKEWYRLTEGAFDATQSKLFGIWSSARKSGTRPTELEIAQSQARATWNDIRLDIRENDSKFSYSHDRISIDVGGLAVGYLIDCMMNRLKQAGIERAMIDAGGDIIVSGPPPDRDGWIIDIAGLTEGAPPVARLQLTNSAVTTSGDLNQFAIIDGIRYSHIVDPRSLLPVTQRRSVTVVASKGIDADAGATALAALGPIDAFRLVETTPIKEVIYLTLEQDDRVPTIQRWTQN